MDCFDGKKRAVALPIPMLLATMFVATIGCAGGFKQWKNNDHKVGPDYRRPATYHAEGWMDADHPQLLGAPANTCCWWTVFNDPVLDEIIQIAYAQNLPLREAGFRIYEARSRLGISRANLFPQTQEASASLNRTQLSNAAFPANLGTPRAYTTWDIGLFSASWEMDIWGRLRRSIESSSAALDASVEDYDAILVMLIGDVASNYMRICTLAQQLAYNQQNIETQQDSLEVAQAKFDSGDASGLDVEQAHSNLAATQAQRPVIELELRQTQNALCVLLGMPPVDLTALLDKPSQPPADSEDSEQALEPWIIPLAPAQVAAGVPADLIRRRPDVRRAEREVAEQCARIGIAYAELFPSFTIQGNLEYSAADFADLFGTGSQAGFIAAPAVRWNILNYGRIRDNISIQDARFQEAVLAYQQSVLVASQEVEDFIAGFLLSQVRYQAGLEAVQAAKRALDLAQEQYQEGAIDFNRVFTLQVNLLLLQQKLAEARQEININLIGVYRGLGGGWQIRLCRANHGSGFVPHTEVVEPIPVEESIPVENGEGESLPAPENAVTAAEEAPSVPENTAASFLSEEPIVPADPMAAALQLAPTF